MSAKVTLHVDRLVLECQRMRHFGRCLVLLLCATCAGACSLLTSFNPEGQPCDAAATCLRGYQCTDAGTCVTASDGGSK